MPSFLRGHSLARLRARERTAFLSGLPLLLGVCCSAPDPPEQNCSERSPLLGGVTQSSYLGFEDHGLGAIGEIVGELDVSVCTGTLIAHDWVLSASHCTRVRNPTFRRRGLAARAVEAFFSHPSLDLALLRLAKEACSAGTEATLAVSQFDAPLDSPAKLSRATLAGYGLTETGTRGELRFVVESVVSVDDEAVMVDGQGRTGACGGDSGGPLLVRDDTGSVSVLGVLSAGESSCRGLDYYLRVDGLRDWIAGFVELPPDLARCGEITRLGRCFDDRALWCEEGRVRAERCDASCGWSASQQGYRCVDTKSCEGDAAGRCVPVGASGVAASHCDQGRETRSACSVRCSYDAATGRAGCIE